MPANKQFALAVHVLVLLAVSAPDSLCSEAMAHSAQANPVSVRRVLGRFRAAGLVASKPGVGGGTHLAQDPATISLADIWRVVHGSDHVLGFYEGQPDCVVGSQIHSMLLGLDLRARAAVEQELASTTVFDLMQDALAECVTGTSRSPVRSQRPPRATKATLTSESQPAVVQG